MTKLYPPSTSVKCCSDLNQLTFMLAQFESISLSEIQSAELLNRVDTKYILGMNQLFIILPELTKHYRVLTINNLRLQNYRTLYFDTNAFTLYAQHHNRLASRYKVRVRQYVDTDTTFFEIKHRTNQHRTIKSRMSIPDVVTQLGTPLVQFACKHIASDAGSLEPKLWNDYLRMTLVSKCHPERVTLDINLRYYWQQAELMLSGVVIVEVKQKDHAHSAEIIQQMRKWNIRSQSYSKYVAGVYSLYEGVKINNFKPQIRSVNKVIQGISENEFTR